jgi:hypothetical protein
MKKIFCALLLSVAVLPVFAQGTGALPPPIPKAASYNLQGMPLSQVVAMVYGQVLKEPYLLDDVVKATPVTVSLKEADPETVRAVLDAYLATKGVTRVQRSGVNLFVPAGKVAGDPVSGAPLPDGVPGLADPLPPVPGGGAGPIAEGLFAAKPSLHRWRVCIVRRIVRSPSWRRCSLRSSVLVALSRTTETTAFSCSVIRCA